MQSGTLPETNYENAVVPEKAQLLLSRFDKISQHYEVADVNKFTESKAQPGSEARK